jgi:drug/metabolite transporter (DMT)-like permease
VGPAPVPPGLYAAAAVLFSLLWASAFVAIKVALLDCPPLLLMASRFLVAGGLLLGAAAAAGRAFPRSGRDWRRLAALGLLNNALYLGVNAFTLRHLDAGMGAMLASTNPLLLALVAPWALGEALTRRKALGLAASYAGVAWAMRERVGPGNQPWAMALFLLTIAFIVAATVLFKRWALRADLLVVNGGQCLAAGLALALPALALERPADVRWTGALLAAQAYMILVVSGAAMLLWLWLLRRGDATRASAYFFLNPIFGLLLGAVFLDERLALRDAAAALVVGAGIYAVQRAP